MKRRHGKATLVLTAIVLAAIAGTTAQANDWQAGLGYTHLSQDGPDGTEIGIGLLVGSVSYRFENDAGFALIPEARLGTGISGDSVRFSGQTVELDVTSFLGFTARGEYAFNDRIAVFAQASFAELGTEASSGGQTASNEGWEFGFGGGIAIRAGRRGAIDLFVEEFDETLLLTGAYRYRF